MTELVIWKEVGLSSVDDAELRRERILNDDAPVPIGELDEQLAQFVRELQRRLPDVVIVQPSGAGRHGPDESSRLYSRQGVVLQLGDDLPQDAHERVLVLTIEPGLTLYDPEIGVIGNDDSIEITIDE